MIPIDPVRRTVVQALALSLLTLPWRQSGASEQTVATALAALETRSGGRLGVCVLDSGSGASSGHRADERFGLCSTFKLLLAAVILREADAGRLALDAQIAFGKEDLVSNSPVTSQHLAAGSLSVGALAQATQKTSDNAAANLLMRQLGGPQGLTAKLRAMGDTTTRLDRWEPQMNLVLPGEEHDTSTPAAIAASVARIFTGDLLLPASRQTLREWTIDTATGVRRLRAGLPADWIAGDKTGTGVAPVMANKYNDVAIIWPADRAPVVIAAYYEASGHFPQMRAEDEAVLAEVGKLAAGWIRAAV